MEADVSLGIVRLSENSKAWKTNMTSMRRLSQQEGGKWQIGLAADAIATGLFQLGADVEFGGGGTVQPKHCHRNDSCIAQTAGSCFHRQIAAVRHAAVSTYCAWILARR